MTGVGAGAGDGPPGEALPGEGVALTLGGKPLPPWQWQWGESASGVGWHARPTDRVDPSQKWRQYLEPATLTAGEVLLARSHMCGFMRAIDPAYRTWWASDLVADRVTQCTRRMRGLRGPGTLGALILRVPPQHLKTYIVEEHAPPFIATQDPCARIINLCYSRSLSKRNVRKWRSIMSTPQYAQVSRARAGRMEDSEGNIERDEAGAHMLRFMIDGGPAGTVHGPGYGICVGAGTEITGWAGDAGIAGDLVKNPDEAFSAHHREKLLGRVQSTFFTRLQPQSTFMLAMSPWHPEDISYQVQNLAIEAGIDCEVIELPARAEVGACKLHPDDPRTPGSGEILDAVRRDAAFYKAFAVLCGRFYKPLGLMAPENFGPTLIEPELWPGFDPHLLIPCGGVAAALASHVYLSIDTNGDENGNSFAHLSIWVAVDLTVTAGMQVVLHTDPVTGAQVLGKAGETRTASEVEGKSSGTRRMLWKLGQVAGPWPWDVLLRTTIDTVIAIGTGIICPWTIIVERKALGPALCNELEQARLGRPGEPGLLRKGVKPWHLHSEYPEGSKRMRADQCKPYVSFGIVALPDRALTRAFCRGAMAGLRDLAWVGHGASTVVDASGRQVATHKQAWGSHPNPLPGAEDLVDADSQVIRYAARQGHIRLPDGMRPILGIG